MTIISFSGSSLGSGKSVIDFRTGLLTESDGTPHNLSGKDDNGVKAVYTSVDSVAEFQGNDGIAIIPLPAARYVSLYHSTDIIKITNSSAFDLWVVGSEKIVWV